MAPTNPLKGSAYENRKQVKQKKSRLSMFPQKGGNATAEPEYDDREDDRYGNRNQRPRMEDNGYGMDDGNRYQNQNQYGGQGQGQGSPVRPNPNVQYGRTGGFRDEWEEDRRGMQPAGYGENGRGGWDDPRRDDPRYQDQASPYRSPGPNNPRATGYFDPRDSPRQSPQDRYNNDQGLNRTPSQSQRMPSQYRQDTRGTYYPPGGGPSIGGFDPMSPEFRGEAGVPQRAELDPY
ncbi:hypothetical protein HK097_000800, partial [Rhizophlyctis rosea]